MQIFPALIYRTDALYNFSFCTPASFIEGQAILANLGTVASKKGTTKNDWKARRRDANWIDYYKQREQHFAKTLRDGGFVQLQNYLFTWSPKTTFRKKGPGTIESMSFASSY